MSLTDNEPCVAIVHSHREIRTVAKVLGALRRIHSVRPWIAERHEINRCLRQDCHPRDELLSHLISTVFVQLNGHFEVVTVPKNVNRISTRVTGTMFKSPLDVRQGFSQD